MFNRSEAEKTTNPYYQALITVLGILTSETDLEIDKFIEFEPNGKMSFKPTLKNFNSHVQLLIEEAAQVLAGFRTSENFDPNDFNIDPIVNLLVTENGQDIQQTPGITEETISGTNPPWSARTAKAQQRCPQCPGGRWGSKSVIRGPRRWSRNK